MATELRGRIPSPKPRDFERADDQSRPTHKAFGMVPLANTRSWLRRTATTRWPRGWSLSQRLLAETVTRARRAVAGNRTYREFWSRFRDRFTRRFLDGRGTEPRPPVWFRLPAGRGDGHYSLSFTRSRTFRVEVYIPGDTVGETPPLWDRLHERRDEIERQLAEEAVTEEVSWESLESSQASRVAVYLDDADVEDSEWAPIIDWALDWAVAVRSVFQSLFTGLDALSRWLESQREETMSEDRPQLIYEDDVIESVCDLLRSHDYTIESTATVQQHGEDIIASSGEQRLIVEAKGEGSSKPHTKRYGNPFTKGQVFDHVAKAVLKALRIASSETARPAIAFPDNDHHRDEIDRVQPALRRAGIGVFLGLARR